MRAYFSYFAREVQFRNVFTKSRAWDGSEAGDRQRAEMLLTAPDFSLHDWIYAMLILHSRSPAAPREVGLAR